MIRAQRRLHQRAWLVLALMLPAVLVVALFVRASRTRVLRAPNHSAEFSP